MFGRSSNRRRKGAIRPGSAWPADEPAGPALLPLARRAHLGRRRVARDPRWPVVARGTRVRSQTAIAREVVERTQALERAKEDRAIATAAQERQRIARKLHDVVAHTLSVMIIQAGAARRTLERAPARTPRLDSDLTPRSRPGTFNELHLLRLHHPIVGAPGRR